MIQNTNIYSEFHKLGDKLCVTLVQKNYIAEIKQGAVDAMWHAMGYEKYIRNIAAQHTYTETVAECTDMDKYS